MSRAKRKRIAAMQRKSRHRFQRLSRDLMIAQPFCLTHLARFIFGTVQQRTAARKPYEAPAILTIEPGPIASELLAALERSGMRRTNCGQCGCELLTRRPANLCPPCENPERFPISHRTN